MSTTRSWPVLVWVGLAACTTTPEKYAEKYPELYCAYIQSCDPPFYEDEADCLQDVTGAAPAADCVFSEEAADACLAELNGLACEGSASNYPAVCNEAWDCP